MYGYFRPYHSNLTHTERQLFNSYYCRICYCLRIVGGQLARFCTTYDGAVYALILALQSKEAAPPVLPCERLGKKNLKLFRDDEVGIKFANLSLISVGEKIRDDRIDKNDFKTKVTSAVFSRAIDKAKAAEPDLAKGSFEGTDRINALQDGGAPLESVFSAYGDMAAESFSHFLSMTKETEELVRSVSEWIFLVDMVCDYNEDYERGTYNGFKTEGLATFSEYFNIHYKEFLSIAGAVTDRMIAALMAVRDDSRVWNTLYKIIIYASDTVIPAAIRGEDVEFHYFSDIFERINENRSYNKDIKRLGIKRDEKD